MNHTTIQENPQANQFHPRIPYSPHYLQPRESLVDYLLARAMATAIAGGDYYSLIGLGRDAARLEEKGRTQ